MSAALEWREPGMPAHHVESACGRYSVSRLTSTSLGAVFYIAWRVERGAPLARGKLGPIVKRTEIGEARAAIKREDESAAAAAERYHAARESMKRRCEEDARA